MGDIERVTKRADGALRKLNALRYSNTVVANTWNGVKQVIEQQRDEILALHAYIDSLEKRE